MDEEGLIARLRAAATRAGAPEGTGVVLGPGDDAALLRAPAGHELVWTCDDQVEDVHFRRAWCSPRAAGRKAIGSAISDLAAMGARPLGVLLALGVPPGFDPGEVEAIGEGLGVALAAAGCPLLGGNIARQPAGLRLSVSVLGCVPSGQALARDAARPGDRLYVSGPLGLARAALRWLEGGGALLPAGAPADPTWAPAVERLLAPAPRLALGGALAARGERLGCLDISDGLARDLPRLLRASGAAARIDGDALPAPAARLAEQVGETCAQLAWRGGEDYELLVAGAPGLEAQPALGLIPIGWVEAGPPGRVTLEGPLAGEDEPGFDHLQP